MGIISLVEPQQNNLPSFQYVVVPDEDWLEGKAPVV